MKKLATRFGSGTAVVTGGGAGLGEGFVRHLGALGMTVVVADVDQTRAQAVADAVVSGGGRAEAVRVDVADPESVEELASGVFERHGSVELLINNAGIEEGGLLWEMSAARWRKVTGVNLDGVFHCIRSFVPRILDSGVDACVANVSSVGAFNSMPVQAAYISTKHAVLALTECLHQELALIEAPIQVSAVLPNWVKSRIFLDVQEEAPTSNAAANSLFGAMRQAAAERGMQPLAAAEHMLDGIARGNFWVFSDDEVCTQFAKARADRLSRLTAPAAPSTILERMGVEVSPTG